MIAPERDRRMRASIDDKIKRAGRKPIPASDDVTE
jgi:hypothetical protein